MKDYFIKLISRLEEKREAIRATAKKSDDLAFVTRSLEEMEDIEAQIAEARKELAKIEEAEAAEARSQEVPSDATLVNPLQGASFKMQERSENPLESMEYRKAFMNYAQNGTPIPAEFRNGEATSTADTGVAIPITVVNRIIDTIRVRYGNLYRKVTKLAVKGGVEFPIGALQASFKWISESTVSPRQKLDKLGKVSFNYYTAEIRIAQTFLSSILTIEAFEAKFTEIIVRAYLKAMDYGIVKGSGDGQMLGIVNDSRVTKSVTMTAADMSDWTAWRKKFFATLPLGYRDGDFIFANATVDAYLETMADSNNNPIFRQATGLEVNSGDAMNPNGRFFGHEIELVEPDVISDFDTANKGDVIGIFWQPEEYAINENFGFTMRRYFDEETNEWVDKALLVVDGKVLNPEGFVKIVKG
jgi:HK97 family phage major capsid protein